MSSKGRIAISPHPRHRDMYKAGSVLMEQQIVASYEARNKERAIVVARIGLRKGDHSDILAMLGLGPEDSPVRGESGMRSKISNRAGHAALTITVAILIGAGGINWAAWGGVL